MRNAVNGGHCPEGAPIVSSSGSCLRHTFGTVMAKKVPLPVLRDLMGHADIIDVGEEQKRDAIANVFGVAAGWQQKPRENRGRP